jgi:hypothetical protein
MAKKYRSSPFVMIRLDLLKDPEWRKISNSAKIVYIYLRAKFNCKTLNEVSLTYSEMNDIISSKTMSEALKKLIKGNWIERVNYGGLMSGSSTFKFTGKYKDFYYKGYKV